MEELRYPVGMQTFSNIIEEGYAYVDKTRYIPLLLNQGKFIFLSRPRRFGKSLLTSTLKAFFQGRRELFKGLDLDMADVDWTPSPVLHFDFNSENYRLENGLDLRLDKNLRNLERIYGRAEADTSFSQRFESLIHAAYEQSGRKVVILIDEYDKPLLDLEDHPEIFRKNQAMLKAFYGNLKSMDEYIRFAFVTGVARFGKVSIFSDLNNLKDISLSDEYADICGWTQEELEHTFRPGIERLAEKREESYETTLGVLRDYYDGYLFSAGGSRLYNPFSVLRALDDKTVYSYWFETGSPAFLLNRVRDQRIYPMDINERKCSRRQLMMVDLSSTDPIPLMFQTGYLTIDSYEPRLERYTLRFPNREVEKAFAEDLLPLYVREVKDQDSPFSIFNFQDDLVNGDPEAFMTRLATLFKEMPYDDRSEPAFRAVTYMFCKVCSFVTQAERHSYKGRSDLEVFTPDFIYIFEFKYGKSVQAAMDQIHSRDYAGRHKLDSRPIFLIAVNYDTSKENRGLQWQIEKA